MLLGVAQLLKRIQAKLDIGTSLLVSVADDDEA